MRQKLVPFALLTGASVANLPVLYGMVQRHPDLPLSLVALALGLVAMGLAWGAGVSLEDRRKGSVRLLCGAALLAPVAALLPGTRDAFGPSDVPWLLAGAALALAGLVLLLRRWR